MNEPPIDYPTLRCHVCRRDFDPQEMVTVHLKARFPDGSSARFATRACLGCWHLTENQVAISIVEDEECDRQERD